MPPLRRGCPQAWRRDLLARRHASRCRPGRLGRPHAVRFINQLMLRLAQENPCWGYAASHGELLILGIKVIASGTLSSVSAIL